MSTKIFRLIQVCLVLLLVSALFSPSTVKAQSNGLKYTVLEGDTIDSIATAFHTTAYRIRRINYIPDLDYIYPGQSLIIPGFDDVEGMVTRVKQPLGKSLTSYFGSLHQPMELLKRLNFITSLDQTWAGAPLYVLQPNIPATREIHVTEGLTGLETAVQQGLSIWALAEYNDLSGPWMMLPNTSLWMPDTTAVDGIQSETAPTMTIAPFPLLQGKTTEFITEAPPEGATLSGSIRMSVNDSLGTESYYTSTEFPLHFFTTDEGRMTALQGVHRFTKPGLAAMKITTTYPDGSTFSYQENLLVKIFDYRMGAPIIVDESYIDPTVTVPEWEMIKSIVKDTPQNKEWTFGFSDPSPLDQDWISSYGLLRSYNDSEYIYFHSGIDFAGNESTPIFAAAAGTVVLAQDLEVRGGATIISHGRGVYTGYWHQSQIDVKVGDHVEAGQTIGMVGGTGRVTGAHLHFEVMVGGVQVDPLEWLQGMY
jgi:murein DD-endopeptidase MepM/ murein hydrolase activator NlpD